MNKLKPRYKRAYASVMNDIYARTSNQLWMRVSDHIANRELNRIYEHVLAHVHAPALINMRRTYAKT